MSSRARYGTQDGYAYARPFASLPEGGFQGLRVWDETNRRLLVWDDELKLYFPAQADETIWSTSNPVMVSSDFREATLNSNWSVASGSDAQALDPAILAGQVTGKVRAATGNAGTGITADGSAISGPLSFQAGNGALSLTGILQLSSIAAGYVFVGFTDTLPSTTLEEPISLTGTTFTYTATDAAGFLFDTRAAVDTIRAAGVKASTGATPLDTGTAPVALTDNRFQIEVSKEGHAVFYLDGQRIGEIVNAVSTNVNLCPIVVACARVTSSINADIDVLGAHSKS